MTRREVLEGVVAVLGGVVSSSLLTALGGCGLRRTATSNWTPKTLTPEQGELVATLAELILPETDTPGARAAGVHEFVDLILADWLDDDERDGFLIQLQGFEDDCLAAHGRAFLDLDGDDQMALLEPLAREAAELVEATAKAGRWRVEKPPFFLTMKEWTLAGYYTSEIGMTQELQHHRSYGLYTGCVPLTEIGRAWA